MDDAEVIARSHEQPAAFEAIFERHFAVVHRYLRRRVGDALAEEPAAGAQRGGTVAPANFNGALRGSASWRGAHRRRTSTAH